MKQMLWLGEAHDRHKQVKHILIWRKWMQSRESVLGGVRGDGVQVQRQDVLGWWAARTLIPWCLSWGGVTDSRTPSDIKFHRSSSLLCKMAHAQSLSHVWLLLPFMDCSLPDSSVHRILQARILAISFSRGPSWPRDESCVSCISHISRQILLSLSHLGSLGPRFALHTITSAAKEKNQITKDGQPTALLL